MKTIRTIVMSTTLLACTSLLANPSTKATSELKAQPSDQNTADKVDSVKKGINKTRTASKNSRENTQNFASKNAQQRKNSNNSHPSNMDINGKTHAELDTYSGKMHSGLTVETPSNEEE
ncbi:hypothetical protein [Acinetobacter sp. NS-4]|uniref:hypothetical protein n=1 Tax=Acinetobacter sp. NS-4 TaxID=3127956 RepID=UPI00307D5567